MCGYECIWVQVPRAADSLLTEVQPVDSGVEVESWTWVFCKNSAHIIRDISPAMCTFLRCVTSQVHGFMYNAQTSTQKKNILDLGCGSVVKTAYLSLFMKSRVCSRAPHMPSRVLQTCGCISWGVKIGKSEFQGHSCLHRYYALNRNHQWTPIYQQSQR